jgi:glycosyltransferase involved in cell wall biosynthesis
MLEHRHDLLSYELVSARGADQITSANEPRTFRKLPLVGAALVSGKWVAHNDAQKARADRIQASRLVLEQVDRTQPDVVLFWQYFSDGGYSVDVLNDLAQRAVPAFVYASNMQLPLHRLVTLHNILQDATVPRWQSLARAARFWWRRTRYKWDYATASINWSNIAFCSHYLKQRHVDLGYPAKSGKVIHWGIDQVADEHAIVHRPLPVCPLRLVWAGRICAPKGLHILLDALLPMTSGAFSLDIYGVIEDVSYWNELSDRIRAAGRTGDIKYCGFLPSEEVRERFKAYDCFVLTSIWAEPFSVVLLEAMAQGLAVITTLTGGTPEIASAENAIVYDAKSPADLAAKLQNLAHSPARIHDLQFAALATVNQFRLETMSDQMYEWLSTANQNKTS